MMYHNDYNTMYVSVLQYGNFRETMLRPWCDALNPGSRKEVTLLCAAVLPVVMAQSLKQYRVGISQLLELYSAPSASDALGMSLPLG